MAKQPIQPRKTTSSAAPAPQKSAPARRVEAQRESIFSKGSRELLYDRSHFIVFGIGLGLVLLGLLLMQGGAMPSPDVWDESLIYSFRRITLAPICMVAGFLTVLYGIFKKPAHTAVNSSAESEPEA